MTMNRDELRGLLTNNDALLMKNIYKIGGVRSAIIYALKQLQPHFPLERINILYANLRELVFFDIADTNADTDVTLSRITGSSSAPLPILLPDALGEPLAISHLEDFKSAYKGVAGAEHLKFFLYASVIRIPLHRDRNGVLVVNFWFSEVVPVLDKLLPVLNEFCAPLKKEISAKLAREAPDVLTAESPASISSYEKIGMCRGLDNVFRQLESVCSTSCRVLILGESGVGKEAVADFLHERSPRKAGPFLKINCGAIPPSLLASVLFGHEKGAFTGAYTQHQGYFEMANGGTLFLDEIGEMPLEAQIYLLRVLDTNRLTRVGGIHPVDVDVRIIAATHDDIMEKVHKRLFRRDLWFRISSFTVFVPPLRSRIEDIPLLMNYFIHKKCSELGIDESQITIPADEIDRLQKHFWPGNVRELEHTVERSLISSCLQQKKKNINFDIAPWSDTPYRHENTEEVYADWPSLKELESRYLQKVLEHTRGRLTGRDGAAEILGIHYSTLRKKMIAQGIPLPRQK